MTHEPNHVRDQAQQDHRNNSQTPKANEQMIPDSTTRETYNAEIERQRQQNR
ncbi:MAG: hypothetical protein QOI12_162 [Alphaproteobacteria bacterium]|jgi:hypothetical protein|nr:hypothetical protein [Alphaproteobacteria bacterium]